MDRTLRWGLIVGVLLAGFGVFYHFVIYLPGQDRERQQAYANCMSTVAKNYDAEWAESCQNIASRAPKLCRELGMSESQCENLVGGADPSPNCSLPKVAAEPIEQRRKEQADTCAKAASLGL